VAGFTLSDVYTLTIVDVSDPSRLSVVGSTSRQRKVETPLYSAAEGRLDVEDGYAFVTSNTIYLTEENGLAVVDVRDPNAPREAAFVDAIEGPRSIDVADGYAYVADWNTGIRVIDVTTPSAPVQVAIAEGIAYELLWHEGYLYVSGGATGLSVVNVQEPGRPLLVGTITVPGMVLSQSVVENDVYAAAGDGGLVTLRTSIAPNTHSVLLPSVMTR
jgi:hypothetical protein